MSIRKRIYLAFAANSFGQGVTIISQILLTPLYFSAWGASRYGEWLLLSTIPAYLIMADIGVGSAAGNEMAMRVGGGDLKGAQRTFWGAIWLSTFATVGVVTFSLLVASLSWQFQIPETKNIDHQDVAIIILTFGLGVSLNFFLGVFSSGFRSCGMNAFGIFLGNVFRMMELMLAAVLLLSDHSPVYICLSGFLVRIMSCAVHLLLLGVLCRWIFAARIEADRGLLRRLLLPSLSFLAFPLGNALALQGPILVLGMTFGSSTVAIFSAMRTLSRVPVQITNVFNSSVWPEMSLAFGSGNMHLLRRLHQRSWLFTVMLVMPTALIIALLGEIAVTQWLGKKELYSAITLNGLLAVSVLSAIWGASAVVLTAVNAHARMAANYVVVNAICLPLSLPMAMYLGFGAFISTLTMAEFVMLLFVFPKVLAISQDSMPSFAQRCTKDFFRAFGLNDR